MKRKFFESAGKKKGSIMKMLPVLLAMMVVTVITIMYFSYMSITDVREKADQIARKYILQMEITGYLSENEKNDLIMELNNIGLNNLDFSETTLTEQEYGNEIKLNIEATYDADEISFVNFIVPQRKQRTYRITISKKTTAKC